MSNENIFLKITQGSFHQGNVEKFGLTAGRQCTCCTLFSTVFSVVKNPGHWDKIDIDYVVENGDKTFKEINSPGYLMFNELPRKINVMTHTFSIDFLDNHSGLLNWRSVPGSIIGTNINPSADACLLIIEGKCISITWNKSYFFLFDSHSRNNLGKVCPNGTSTLMKFKSRKSTDLFILNNYLPEKCENIQFDLQYLSISIENKDAASEIYKRNRKINKKDRT